jgi:acyl-CoA synthetase (AMP-forming)/AMP-acid ligase II
VPVAGADDDLRKTEAVMDDPTTKWLYAPRADAGLHFLQDDGTWRTASYEELAGRVWAMAEALIQEGVAGERLGLVASTDEDYVVQLFATLVTGGTCVPLPSFMAGQDEPSHRATVKHALETARPAAVLRSAGAGALDGWPAVEVPSYHSLPAAEPKAPVDSQAPIAIQFTTGTTGAPKGVRIGRPAMSASLRAFMEVLPMSRDERGAMWLPLSYLGVMLPSPAYQTDLLLLTPLQFYEDPARWLRCFGTMGCTLGSAPTFGYSHIRNRVDPESVADCRFDGWRAAVIAAEPPRTGDLDAFIDAFGPLGFRREAFCPAYGLSEAALSVTQAPVGRGPVVHPGQQGPSAIVGSGVLVPGCRVAIRLADGTDAPEGVTGEIVVGGETLADGYEPGEDFGEWVATGDAGCMYDGELFVVGRVADSFQYLGERYFAPDAEAKIQARTRGALAVAVVPSRAAGVGITVVVESTEEWPPPRADEEAEAVSALFDGIEVDLLVVAPGGIPRTPGGKPQRRECFERYVSSGVAAEHLPSS